MNKKKLASQVLTSCALLAIVYLFFHEARVALKPVPVSLHPTQVAYGYENVVFTGTVYHDEGVTAVGAGLSVAASVNGAAVSATDTTNASGQFTLTGLSVSGSDVVTLFINNEAIVAGLVGKFNESEVRDLSVTNMDLYKNRLITRTSSTGGLTLTSSDLDIANNLSDSDINALYHLSGSTTVIGPDREFYVWNQTTFLTSGALVTHDLDVLGTLTMPTGQDITASGTIVASGSLTFTGDLTLTSTDASEELKLNGHTITGDLSLQNGLLAYWRFDEGSGRSVTGSTLSSASGSFANIATGSGWVESNTGTTLFYNPYTLEFGGGDDYVDFDDYYALDAERERTFSLWFRRKETNVEHALFAKRVDTLSTTRGYSLTISDGDEKLYFAVSDSLGEYRVGSDVTITDQNWHHVAVTWSPYSASGVQMYLDGVALSESRSGTLGGLSMTAIDDDEPFTIGNTSDGLRGFRGTIDDVRLYSYVLTGSQIAHLAAGNKTTGSGVYRLGSDLSVSQSLKLYTGTLDVDQSSHYDITLSGDLVAYGTLQTQSGTVTLNGADQAVKGSTHFRNLVKNVSTTRTITFESNTKQTLSGSLTLQGAVNNLLRIRSSVFGDPSFLVLEGLGAQALRYLDVQDSNALSGATLTCSTGCVDNSRNTNWVFLGECGDGVLNTGETCDDGNTLNSDACLSTCTPAFCGDGFVNLATEQCEPPGIGSCANNCFFKTGGGGGGGTTGGDSASSAGQNTSFYNRPPPPDGCGNGIHEPDRGEECDEGARFNGLGTCSYTCKILYCGDGIVTSHIGESCEPTVLSREGGVIVYDVPTCGEICTAPVKTQEGSLYGGCQRRFLAPCDGSAPSPEVAHARETCGDGTVDAYEECDFGGICDGGRFSGLFWTDAKSAKTCMSGGGTAVPVSGDGCSADCLNEFCGDGVVQRKGSDNTMGTDDDELCDNGRVCSHDSSLSCRSDADCDGNVCTYHTAKNNLCSAACIFAICGNGIVEKGETCDDSNQRDGDGCSSSCQREGGFTARAPELHSSAPQCGNGVIEDQEECDDGLANSNLLPNACRTDCRRPRCGDYTVDAQEQCDDGDGNSDLYADACRTDCTFARCGDGVIDSGEQCDGSSYCSVQCDLFVTPGLCGNGTVEIGEQCDDSNGESGDGCSRFCQREALQSLQGYCGNGRREPGEQCDDGNTEDLDGCSSACRIEDHPVHSVAADSFYLDADVVIVNPEEIANALTFLPDIDPCSVLVVKGEHHKAQMIREAALSNNIPIIRNVPLARTIFAGVAPGENIVGDVCRHVLEVKRDLEGTKAAPTEQIAFLPPPAPSYPLIATLPSHAPRGDTGPLASILLSACIAAGVGWVRRKRV